MKTVALAGLVASMALLANCGSANSGPCDTGLSICWQECVDLQSSRDHCGECGTVCGAGTHCSSGVCVECSHACAENEARCADADRLQSCVSDSNSCRYWAEPVDCGEGAACKYGRCEAECNDSCPNAGQTRCQGSMVQTCVAEEGTACLYWSLIEACGRCSECMDDACHATCMDECDFGNRECDGVGYRECGDFDADEAFEWSETTPCPAGEVCEDGSCGPDVCQDDCGFDGARRCLLLPEASVFCADHDGDGCLEWGGQELCAERCGACVDGECVSTCTDECLFGELQCIGDSWQECADFDADEAYEWGPLTDCQADEFCQAGLCEPLQQGLGIDIYVDNFCAMDVVPAEVTVPAGSTAVLTYHNRSQDYPVDVWLSYGGGFLDLPTGQSWADAFEWCTGASVYTGYADIDSACSSHRLLIHCL